MRRSENKLKQLNSLLVFDPEYSSERIFMEKVKKIQTHYVLAIKGPFLAIFRKRGLWDTPRIVKFGMEHPWAY